MTEDSATYLGQKGYTIYKNNICVKEQKFLREELMVKPYMPKSPVQPPAFPIYRESQNKIYVPRFFGVETYGDADETKLADGENIDVVFNGSLRDYQINIVKTYYNHVNNPYGGGGLLEIDLFPKFV